MSTSPVPLQPPASGRSIASLVLGLLGLMTCTFLSPVAWYLGAAELRDIRAGLASGGGRDLATVGMVLGIIGTSLVALVLLVILVVGAIAAVAIAAGAAQ